MEMWIDGKEIDTTTPEFQAKWEKTGREVTAELAEMMRKEKEPDQAKIKYLESKLELTKRKAKKPESIMIAKFPEFDPSKYFPDSLLLMDRIIEVRDGIASLKGRMNIPMKKKVPVIIKTEQENCTLLTEHKYYLKGYSDLQIALDGTPPENCSLFVTESGVEIFIPITEVNTKEEKGCIEKEIKTCSAELEKISKKLMNSDFLEKAPTEVVEKNRVKQHTLQNKLDKLIGNIQQLSK